MEKYLNDYISGIKENSFSFIYGLQGNRRVMLRILFNYLSFFKAKKIKIKKKKKRETERKSSVLSWEVPSTLKGVWVQDKTQEEG